MPSRLPPLSPMTEVLDGRAGNAAELQKVFSCVEYGLCNLTAIRF